MMSDYYFKYGAPAVKIEPPESPAKKTVIAPAIIDISSKFKHTYIIGKTGTGKSSIMESMAFYDIKQGLSVIYIDPKGDSVNKLYSRLKDNDNVDYISFKKPMVINPLNKQGYSIDDIITEFSQVMDILITRTSPNPEMTVRMKEILTNALKGLFSINTSKKQGEFKNNRNDPNIFEKLRDFLFNPDEMDKYIKQFTDIEAKKWWTVFSDSLKKKGFRVWGEFNLTFSSLSSRLSQFLFNDDMKKFINGKNQLSIEKLVSEGKSLLVNTYTPSLDNMVFLSNLIVYAVYSYIHQDRSRKPLIVYVDEFQLCSSELFPWLLNKSRSYQVGFVLAHQNFASIPSNIISSILGVVNSMIILRCGDEEAKRFASYCNTGLTELLCLDDYQAYIWSDNKSTLINLIEPLKGKIENPITYNFFGNSWIHLPDLL